MTRPFILLAAFVITRRSDNRSQSGRLFSLNLEVNDIPSTANYVQRRITTSDNSERDKNNESLLVARRKAISQSGQQLLNNMSDAIILI